MPQVIGCDAHKQFSVFVQIDGKGKTSPPVRVDHHRQEYAEYLRTLPPGSEIALEATGHWYWMVDEMEKAGHRPHLANPTEAKRRMGKTNKTDALDAKGACDPVAQRHPARELDSAGRAARPARAAAHPHGLARSAHLA